MNRRGFVQGVAGLALAGSGELIERPRRFWGLDRTMLGPEGPDTDGPLWRGRIWDEPPDVRVPAQGIPTPVLEPFEQQVIVVCLREKKRYEEALLAGGVAWEALLEWGRARGALTLA